MPNPVHAAIRAVAEAAVLRIGAFNRRRSAPADSPFLVGVHAPMPSELTLSDLPVTGAIPPGLNGRYLKMGANPVRPDHAGHHWFLGDGMVHGIALRDGRALWYRNRWIGSRLAAAALGRPAAPGPRRGRNDTVNTNVVEIAGRATAVVEAGSLPAVLGDTLDTQRYSDFAGTLQAGFSGHPHRDPRTGEHHAITYDANVGTAIRHVVVSGSGQVVRELPIPVRHGPCVHDCAITARFVVVLDLPVTFSLRAVLAGQVFPYRWNPAHPARLGLLPRDGAAADIVWCPLDPCFVFHVANAFDAPDNQVVLDVIAYDTMFASGAGGLDALGRLERWTVDPATHQVARRVIDATPQEFPRMDERRFGQPYRYAYTVAVPPDGDTQLRGATQLFRHDLHTGGRRVHEFGEGRIPGEFVFVPASAEAAEDEGWLLGLVIDVAAEATDLVILDARARGRAAGRRHPPAAPDPAGLPRQLVPVLIQAHSQCTLRPCGWAVARRRSWPPGHSVSTSSGRDSGRGGSNRSQASGAASVAAAPARSSVCRMAAWVGPGMYCHMMEWYSTVAWFGAACASCPATQSAASARSTPPPAARATAMAASSRASRSGWSAQT